MAIRYLSGVNIDSNTLFVDDVNNRVGIGTTSPNRTLTVNGIVGVTNGTANTQQLVISTDANGAYLTSSYIGSSSYVPMIFETGGSERMRITTAGNVGIGTTSPAYKTSVVASNGNYWNGTAFTGTPLALSIENSEPGGYDPVLIYNQADSGGTLKNSGAIGMVGTGPWTAGNNALQVSDMYFLIRNSSGGISERLRIKSTGAAQLKAYGSGSFTGTVAYNLAVDSSGNIIETAGGVVDGSGTANYVSKWSDANTLTDSVIYDNGTNVGIGTTAPLAPLDVNGNIFARSDIRIGGDYAGNSTAIIKWQGGAADRLGIFTWADAKDIQIGGNNVLFATESGAERMRITSGGNVGIGTTSPNAKLDVYNGTSRFWHGGTTHYTEFNNSNEINTYASNGTISTMFLNWVSGGDVNIARSAIYAASAGNVGIGTTSPGDKLHVNAGGTGGIRIQADSEPSLYLNTTDGAANATLFNSYGNVGLVGYATSTNYIMYHYGGGGTLANQYTYFQTAGAERMRINGAGLVAIGNTNPQANSTSAVIDVGNTTGGTVNLRDTDAGASGFNQIFGGNNQMYFYAGSSGASSVMQFYTNDSERMRITADGSLLVGATNSDIGGSVKGAIIRQDGSIVAARNIASPFHYQTPISADRMNTMGDGIMYSMWREGIFQAGIGATNTSNMTFFTGDNSNAYERMRIASNGVVRLNAYGSGGITGTPAYNLAVDASGDIIELPGGVVDGSGTANYVTKWQDANTVTNSIIRDDGTTVGIGAAPAAAKLTVDGALTAAGQTSYGKSYASLDTTGVAVAGLSSSSNGQSALFTFTCYGGDNHYQRVVYSCKNDSGSWYTSKVIDEGTNGLDVTASANGATITFTYKARSSNQGYSPRILIDHLGSALNTSYL